MAKGKKKKDQNVKTFSMNEFIQEYGIKSVPVYKEVKVTSSQGESTKLIDITQAPTAPQSSYEVVVQKEIIEQGPPYPLVVRNIPFDSDQQEIKNFFGSANMTVELVNDENNKFRGIAVVTFQDFEEYKSALEKDGLKLNNRPLVITQGSKLPSYDRDPMGGNQRKSNYGSRYGNTNYDELTYSEWRSGNRSEYRKPSGYNNNHQESHASTVTDWREAANEQASNPFGNNRNDERGRNYNPDSWNKNNDKRKRYDGRDGDRNRRYGNNMFANLGELDFSIMRSENKHELVAEERAANNTSDPSTWGSRGNAYSHRNKTDVGMDRLAVLRDKDKADEIEAQFPALESQPPRAHRQEYANKKKDFCSENSAGIEGSWR